MTVLADTDRAAVGAFELALLFQRAEIFADAVLRDLEFFAEITDAHLAVPCQHV